MTWDLASSLGVATTTAAATTTVKRLYETTVEKHEILEKGKIPKFESDSEVRKVFNNLTSLTYREVT